MRVDRLGRFFGLGDFEPGVIGMGELGIFLEWSFIG